MKKIMKKVLSLALVVALAVAPVTVMAADSGTADLATGLYAFEGTAVVAAHSTVYYEICMPDDAQYEFVVTGPTGFSVGTCYEIGGVWEIGAGADDTNGTVNTTIKADSQSWYGYAGFAIENTTASEQEYTYKIVLPEGAQGNPKKVTLAVGGSAQVTIPAGAQYYVGATLPEMNKEYQLKVTGNTGFKYGAGWGMPTPDTNGEYTAIVSASMYSGGSASFYILNTTTTEQTYTLSLANMPLGSASNPDALSIDYTTVKELDNIEYWYTWTATEAGKFVIEIVPSLCEGGWTYNANNGMDVLNFSTGWDEDDKYKGELNVEAGTVVKVGVSVPTYNSEYDYWDVYTPGEGKVVFKTSFEAGQSAGGGAGSGGNIPVGGGNSSSGDNYVGSENPLINGENAVSTEKDYTIFTFEPTEIGKYTFISADGSKLGIASYNGMWVTIDPSAETVKETQLTWDCTGVGQSIWLAVDADDDSANILITKEAIEIDQIEKKTYENKKEPSAFTFPGKADKLEYVNTEDKVVDKAVLGNDGYYHLNTADGPVLFVDLDDKLMNLIDAMGYGQLKEVVYEGGTATLIVDYNTAFGKYADVADKDTKLYPLTEDLIAVYQKVGESQKWYGENGFVGGTEADAWMFACYYQKGLNTLGNSGAAAPGGATQAPNTGDNANVAVWATVMVVAAGAAFVVAESKRRAR